MMQPFRLGLARFALLLLAACAGSLPVAGEESPLHQRIDQTILESNLLPVGSQAADADFVRRIYLDLIGRVPSAAEARAFLADTAENKRVILIDRLLEHPEFDRHMADWLDVMLTERVAATNTDAGLFWQHLYDGFAARRPLNEMIGEVLAADGAEDSTRHLARFTLDRDVEPNLLTRDIGRLLFGRDLQCAQCHDHPLIDGYRQREYHQLFAFLNRTGKVTTKVNDKDVINITEKADGQTTFTSVFEKRWSVDVQPALPGGQAMEDPAVPADQLYKVAPKKDKASVPMYSRRVKLAELIGGGQNRMFARNIANRLWATMMGRGLVEPLDLGHAGNPPVYPQLLDALADGLIASNYDVRQYLREIALSQTYQRSIDVPAVDESQEKLAEVLAQADPVKQSLQKVLDEFDAAEDRWQTAYDAWGQSKIALGKLQPTYLELAKKLNESTAAEASSREKLAAAEQQIATMTEAHGSITAALESAQAAAALQPELATLAEATTLLKQQADTLASKLSAIQLARGLVAQALEAATKAAAEAKAALDPIAGEYETAVAAERAARQTMDEAFDHRCEVDATITQTQRRRQVIEATESLGHSATALARAMEDQQRAQTHVAEARAELAKLEQRLASTQSLADQADHAAAAAAETVQTAEQSMQTIELALVSVTEAHDQLLQAQQGNNATANFGETINKLASRQSELNAKLEAARKEVSTRQATAEPVQLAAANARTMLSDLQGRIESAGGDVTAAEQQLQTAQDAVATAHKGRTAARAAVAQQMTRRFLIRPLEPLSPEELAWSLMEATSVTESYRMASKAELEKEAADAAAKAKEEGKEPPAAPVIDDRAIEKRTYAKLKGVVQTFIHTFGSGAGQPQRYEESTVDQSLFLANNGTLVGWSQLAGNRLNGIADNDAAIEELYLATFARMPSPDERQAAGEYLAARANDRTVALSELAWALLTSTEFRFNH